VLVEQDYCDWCYGSIDTVDRHLFEDVGVSDESTWACSNCIESGRIFRPPDGWERDLADWPVKDISDHLSLAKKNVEVVLSDVHRTTEYDRRSQLMRSEVWFASPTGVGRRRRLLRPSRTHRRWPRRPTI
jgi:hypothetical protein